MFSRSTTLYRDNIIYNEDNYPLLRVECRVFQVHSYHYVQLSRSACSKDLDGYQIAKSQIVDSPTALLSRQSPFVVRDL